MSRVGLHEAGSDMQSYKLGEFFQLAPFGLFKQFALYCAPAHITNPSHQDKKNNHD